MKKSVKFILSAVILAVIFVSATLLYNYLSKTYSPSEQGKQEPVKAIDFTVFDAEGSPHNLSDFYGKPILVNFWATWCPNCVAAMPSIQNMYEKYGEDIIFMMVNATDGVQETVKGANAYISDKGYTFPVYYDTEYSASYAYRVSSIPQTVLINEDGEVSYAYIGAVPENILSSYINKYLLGK